VDTGLNIADVREVARGHLFAYEKARPGERYILGGQDLTLKQLLDELSKISGLPLADHAGPHGLAYAFACFDEFWTGRVLGKEPRATRER